MRINYFLLLLFVFVGGCVKPVNYDYNNKYPCDTDIAKEFLRWNKVKGEQVKGLTKRRQVEYNFFMKGCYNVTPVNIVK